MVDICMRTWKECPIKINCYRSQATPDEQLQISADFKTDYNPKTGYCKAKITIKLRRKENGNKKKTES